MEALLAAAGLVFLAELGDKTQLIAVGLGARHRTGPVLVGMAIGYGLSNAIASLVGGVLGTALPSEAIGVGGGVLFLVFAVQALRHADDHEDAPALPAHHIIRTVAVAMLVAELGDKTQLATATLATQANPVLVWAGSTIGITASGAVGVAVGSAVGTKLPEHAIRIASAVLFAAFGVGLIVAAVV